MGKFEDLIAKARDGDMEALTQLENEFNATNLREQSEAAVKTLQENEEFIREGKFRRLVAEAEVEGLSIEDLEGVESKDFTIDLVRTKADEKAASVAAIKVDIAKNAGFDSVEEYDTAMAELKEKQVSTKQGLEALGGATASTSGGQAPPAETKEPYEVALEDYESAKKSGATQDIALGEAMHTHMAAQHPAPEEGQ